ncbi:MAG: ketopantoate reductase family protein [Trueperaceae bacterium]|nr:ketopantoate reductase family protein [Trueperaceae bacterium]
MRTLIWGAGAIGGTIAAYAARAGREVTLVDVVDEHVDAIDAGGLRITGPVDTFTAEVGAVTPERVQGRWDAVLLCTKALHTEAATDAIAPHLADDGFVVSVQNGLNEFAIAERVGAERTVGAFVNFGADYLEPGVIHFGGRGAVVVGELDGRSSERLAWLLDLLRTFEPNAIATDNIWGYLWGKMGYGAMLFASALCDESIADVLDSREARPILDELAAEVLAVAYAEGIEPLGFNGFDPVAFGPDGDARARAASYEAMVTHNRGSAKTHSGVWRDLAVRKRKTEAEAQFGEVLARAEAHGLHLPLTRRLVEVVRQVEQGDRPQAWGTLMSLAEASRASPA